MVPISPLFSREGFSITATSKFPAYGDCEFSGLVCAVLSVTILVLVPDPVLVGELLVFGTAAVIVCLDTSLAIPVLLVLIPFNVVRPLPGGGTFSSELLKLVVVPVIFWEWYRRGGTPSLRTSIDLPVLIYAFLLISSIARADHPSFAYKEIGRALSNIGVFYSVVVGVRTERHVRRSVRCILFVAFVIAGYGLYQACVDDYGAVARWFNAHMGDLLPDWRGRINSIIETDNELGAFLNLCWPCALLYNLQQHRSRGKLLGVAAVGTLLLFLMALLLTFSRGAWTACSVGFLVLFLYFWRRSLKLVVSFSVALLGMGFVLWLFGLWRLLLERASGVEPEIVATRYFVWASAITLFKGNPLLGIGYGNFVFRYGDLVPSFIPADVIGAHNVYFLTLAQTGLVGLVALLWIIGGTAYQLLRAYRLYPQSQIAWFLLAAGCSLLTVLIHGFFDDVGLFAMHTQFLVFALLGLSHAALRICKQQEAPTLGVVVAT